MYETFSYQKGSCARIWIKTFTFTRRCPKSHCASKKCWLYRTKPYMWCWKYHSRPIFVNVLTQLINLFQSRKNVVFSVRRRLLWTESFSAQWLYYLSGYIVFFVWNFHKNGILVNFIETVFAFCRPSLLCKPSRSMQKRRHVFQQGGSWKRFSTISMPL